MLAGIDHSTREVAHAMTNEHVDQLKAPLTEKTIEEYLGSRILVIDQRDGSHTCYVVLSTVLRSEPTKPFIELLMNRMLRRPLLHTIGLYPEGFIGPRMMVVYPIEPT